MNADQASLDNLRDIVELAPVSWWPLANGWWMLFALVAIVAAIIAYRFILQWRNNAYRREALRELHAASSVAEMSEILKRTALVAFPRVDVASLAGKAWANWLGEAIGETVPPLVRQSLTTGIFEQGSDENTTAVSSFAERWIQRHPSHEKDH